MRRYSQWLHRSPDFHLGFDQWRVASVRNKIPGGNGDVQRQTRRASTMPTGAAKEDRMHAEIAVDPQQRFLRFHFAQHATVADWEQAQAAFVRLSNETGIRRALVDIRGQEGSGPALDLFQFGSNIPAGMAFAVLSGPARYDHAFVETVAINRGKNVRLFFGPEEEAIEWLIAQAV
jgi:hypothetical protein